MFPTTMPHAVAGIATALVLAGCVNTMPQQGYVPPRPPVQEQFTAAALYGRPWQPAAPESPWLNTQRAAPPSDALLRQQADEARRRAAEAQAREEALRRDQEARLREQQEALRREHEQTLRQQQEEARRLREEALRQQQEREAQLRREWEQFLKGGGGTGSSVQFVPPWTPPADATECKGWWRICHFY
ncbi:MAG: hypothetical protein AB7F35_16570 [Acetobacteraceae bacterium]